MPTFPVEQGAGEVAPIPGIWLPIPPTCANAGMQPKSAASIAAIKTRRMMISIALTQRSGRLGNGRAIGCAPQFQSSQQTSDVVTGTLGMQEFLPRLSRPRVPQ